MSRSGEAIICGERGLSRSGEAIFSQDGVAAVPCTTIEKAKYSDGVKDENKHSYAAHNLSFLDMTSSYPKMTSAWEPEGVLVTSMRLEK